VRLTLGTNRYRVKKKIVNASSLSPPHPEAADENPVRRRIVSAAFSVLMERGYAETSTLEIATRARVSKRELYALVGNKQEMLVACISERARRLRMPEDLPLVRDRETLARLLVSFGARLLREVSDPTVVAVFRLAIARGRTHPQGRPGARYDRTRDEPGRLEGDANPGAVCQAPRR
jgi:AcrR family transcriptional regulator